MVHELVSLIPNPRLDFCQRRVLKVIRTQEATRKDRLPSLSLGCAAFGDPVWRRVSNCELDEPAPHIGGSRTNIEDQIEAVGVVVELEQD